MGEYYHQYLTSMVAIGGDRMASPQEIAPPHIPASAIRLTHAAVALQGQYVTPTGVGYFPVFPETADYPPRSHKGRRKVASMPGTDNVKHRRTRSGCFTCRNRRVKCDEGRPICHRCIKGKRECAYPDPPVNRRSAARQPSSSQPGSPATSSADEHAEAERDHLETRPMEPIPDETEEDYHDDYHDYPAAERQHPHQHPHQQQQTTPKWVSRRASSTSLSNFGGSETTPPPREGSKSSPSPSTTSGTGTAQPGSPARPEEWAHLPAEMRQHLDYFCENITHYHYCMSSDVDDFFRLTLPSLAVRHEALLHAVVGFSAYHAAFDDPDGGSMSDFLAHFNRSVQLLIDLFRKKEKPNVGTLLTILQLGTMEEYLGDWVNLLGHQKAAFEILMDLFTPETIMQTPLGRVIILWYVRFDAFVALMGGFPTSLPPEWFAAMVGYHRARCAEEPANLRWKYALISADLRLICMEMSVLIARGHRDTITPAQFAAEHGRISARLEEWHSNMDPALTDPAYLVKDLARPVPPDPDDIVDPYEPGVLYDAPLFMTTIMTAEWNSVMIMHKCQAPPSVAANRERFYAELARHAYDTCRIFETVEKWPLTPRGGLILAQAPLGIASLFLPPDQRNYSWIKRKFALMEQQGYIQTLSIRSKMAYFFGDPNCVRWWLPNDEGFSRVLQLVRAFADERNAVAQTAQAESIRECTHIFSKMELSV